jgi:uncharacterized protein YbcI
MTVKELEKKLAKILADVRREQVGRGSLDVQVRISGDSMYVKFKTQYSQLEKYLMTILTGTAELRHLFDGVRATFTENLRRAFLGVFGDDVHIVEVFVNNRVECDNVYVVIQLDTNLERLVKTPKGSTDQTT